MILWLLYGIRAVVWYVGSCMELRLFYGMWFVEWY